MGHKLPFLLSRSSLPFVTLVVSALGDGLCNRLPQIFAAMASHRRQRFIILFLLALLVVSNFSPIGAKARESGENPDLEDEENSAEEEHSDEYIHDDENGFEESVEEDGGEDNDEEEDEEETQPFDETNVVVLGSNNFTNFVAKQRHLLVQFYAPWCGHCSKFAPQWAAAATALKGQVTVAKVDATAHVDISEELLVDRYPTFLFFLDGFHSSYNGHRSKDAIVNYVNMKMSRSVRALMSVSDIESLLEVKSPMAIAYLKKLKGPEVFELTVVARQQDDVAFYMTNNEHLASVLGFENLKTKPVLALIKTVAEERLFFKGAFKRKALNDFVSANKLPLVIFYKRETAALFFENAIQKQVLCFVRDEEYWGHARPLFEEVARAFRGQALFVCVSLSDQVGGQVAEFFGVTGEIPIVIMAVIAEDGPKYLYEGEFTVEGIKDFVEGFMKNKLRPYYKSQAIPAPSTEDVKTAVGKNFEEVVLDETKDTLLELYSPWCHHCQDLEPIYKKLAKLLKNIPSISIVKMDGVANEHPHAKVDGFPSILFYPANKKKFEPIKFEGDATTVKGLYRFLKKHAAIPFALPKPAPKSKDPIQLKDEL